MVVHVLLLGLAVTALGGAALRAASALTIGLGARSIGAVALAAGLAVTQSLLLGLVGAGSNSLALSAVAGATWIVMRVTVAAPLIPAREQVREAWANTGPVVRAGLGAAAALTLGVTAYQLGHPTYGGDGLTYHVAQPAMWIADGHPGSMHESTANFPTQAYPKTMEVLVGWVLAIARSGVAAVPLVMLLSVLAVASTLAGLMLLRVSPAVAVLATAAGLLLPFNVLETNGVYSDLPALAWSVCAAALCVDARERPRAIGLAAVAGGLAIGTKPSVGFLVVLALVWGAWPHRRRLSAYRNWTLLLLAFGAGLGALWYVDNWVVYGAPLWPFSRFPAGPPLPLVWREYGASFLDDPLGTVRALGWTNYHDFLGGGLVLIAAVPVVAVVAVATVFRRGPQGAARIALLGSAAIAANTVLWAASKFTGVTHGNPIFAATGLRYLTPSVLAEAALLAVLTRYAGPLRVSALGLLVAAVAMDAVEVVRPRLGTPFRPALITCFGLLLVGGVAGLFSRHIPRPAWSGRALAPVAGVTGLVASLLLIPAVRQYPHTYAAVERSHDAGDRSVLTYLEAQPGWAEGHVPVYAHVAWASLAGLRFTHPLHRLEDSTSCSEVKADMDRGIVVLQAETLVGHVGFTYPAATCLAGVPPVATLGTRARIYAGSQGGLTPGR